MVSAPSLVRLGFAATADVVYRTLSASGPQSVASLARDLGLPQQRVAESLAALHAAGLVSAARAAPATRQWSAAPPERVEAAARARARPISGWTGFRFDLARLGPGVTHLTNRRAARLRMAEIAAAARHEHLAMNPEPAFDESAMRAAGPMDKQLLDRGVRMRVLGVQPENRGLLIPYGGEALSRLDYREAIEVPMKLVIVDRRVALFPVDPHNYELGYLEISDSPVVESLSQTFERHWASANRPSQNQPALDLTPREGSLLQLLAQGHTDAAAARKLGISERSVSNIIRALMDRFGLRTRFQLGLAIGALGAVSPPPGVASPST